MYGCEANVVCVCVLALRQAGDLSRVDPAARPLIAGIDSSRAPPPKIGHAGIENGWMDGNVAATSVFHSGFWSVYN